MKKDKLQLPNFLDEHGPYDMRIDDYTKNILIKSAFIRAMGGIAKYHSDGGIMGKDRCGWDISISFPTKSPNHIIVRTYADDGFLWKEKEFKDWIKCKSEKYLRK